jgi:PAS domain S-box-containing protein
LRDLSELGDFAAEAIKSDSVSFIAWYPDREILTVNRQFINLMGYSAEEISHMMCPESFVSEELAGRITAAMDLLSKSDKSCSFTGEIIRKNLTRAPVIILIHKYFLASELLLFAFIEDVTQYRRLEERLKLTQFAIDHFTDSSIWLDANGRLMDVNDTAPRTLGYSREELLEKNI